MPKLKILLGRGSPRSNIKEVEKWNESLPCDKIIPRYFLEWPAYQLMRNFFLRHKEYTHLVLATDDIVVTPEHILQLQEDIEKFDYSVLSGVMNVEKNNRRIDPDALNISMTIAQKDRRFRAYEWIKIHELPDKDIFQVMFSGFPLMAIRRDIIEITNFDADRVFEGKPSHNGASLDLVFCWHCKEKNIPIMVDKRIMMNHKRKAGEMMINKKDKKLEFWEYGSESVVIPLDP